MNIVLDHCLDWRLGRHILGHKVKHVGKMGWAALKNGQLLAKAQNQFDILVTSDKNLRHQQNLSRFDLAVVILDVPSNRIEDCLPKIPTLLEIIPRLIKGRAVVI